MMERQDLAREASEWLIRLRLDEPNGDRLAAWTAWLEKSGAREAYDAAVDAWVLGSMVSAERPNERQLAQDDYDGASPVATWLRLKRRRARLRWAVAAVIALAVAGGSDFAWNEMQRLEPLRALVTARAEQRETHLSDGSKIRLGAMSALDVSYSRHHRSIALRKGEADFEVAHDPLRPFVVSTPIAAITAVGTAFDIDIDSSSLVLRVTQGVVQVDPGFGESSPGSTLTSNRLRVRAGERLEINAAAKRLVLYEIGSSPSRIWLPERVEYRDEPLQSVIEDVNRYAQHPIQLGNQEIGKLTYTGTLYLNAADDWVYGLPGTFPVAIETKAGIVILIGRGERSPLKHG